MDTRTGGTEGFPANPLQKPRTGPQRNHAANTGFERSFLSRPLERQIHDCEAYELVPCFRQWLADRQPILEAGCGSGRWVAWFAKNGWEAVGLDWSEALCERARQSIPGARFVVGDMRAMPFADGEFGSLVSLGSVEHTVEGPSGSLREYHRVLRPGGIAIITVPYLGPVRRVFRTVTAPVRWLEREPLVRSLFGRRPVSRASVRETKKELVPGWAADFVTDESRCSFYQYNFSKEQMRRLLKEAGFELLQEFVAFTDEGIMRNFGGLAGRYVEEGVALSPWGRLLRKAVPADAVGHMLCHVVRRP